jgi:hypothetical protein
MLIFVKFIESRAQAYLLVTGFLSGFLLFTKQDLGAASIAATGGFLLFDHMMTKKGDVATDIIFYGIGLAAGVFPVINHSLTTGIMAEMINCVFGYGHWYAILLPVLAVLAFFAIKAAREKRVLDVRARILMYLAVFALPIMLSFAAGAILDLKDDGFKPLLTQAFSTASAVDLPKAKYIKADPEEGAIVVSVVKAIKDHTSAEDKIFGLNACGTFYILAERRPAAFFTVFTRGAFDPKDQARVISDLKANDVKLVLAAKDRMGSLSGGRITAQVEKYILENYDLKYTMGNYLIFLRRAHG